MTTQEALNAMNANPCTAWDPEMFGAGWSGEQVEAARKAWHAAIYAAAIAISTQAQTA